MKASRHTFAGRADRRGLFTFLASSTKYCAIQSRRRFASSAPAFQHPLTSRCVILVFIVSSRSSWKLQARNHSKASDQHPSWWRSKLRRGNKPQHWSTRTNSQQRKQHTVNAPGTNMQHLTQTWITLKVVNSSSEFCAQQRTPEPCIHAHAKYDVTPAQNKTKNWKQNIATHWANCVPTTVRHTYDTSNCTANQKQGMKSKRHVEVFFLGRVPNCEAN